MKHILLVLFFVAVGLASGQTFGGGCVAVSVLPSPGATLEIAPSWSFALSFSTDVGLFVAGKVQPLAFWNSSALLTQTAAHSFLNLTTLDGAVTVEPTGFQIGGNRTIIVTFPSIALVSFDTCLLKIGSIFVGLSKELPGLPVQGWMTFGIGAPPKTVFPAPPVVPCAALRESYVSRPTEPVDASIIVECSTTCTLAIEATMPLSAHRQLDIPSTVYSSTGDAYILTRIPNVEILGQETSTSIPLGLPSSISPVFEAIYDDTVPLDMWKEVSSADTQKWLDLVTTGPTWSGNQGKLTFPLELGREYNPSDDSLQTSVIESNPDSYLGKITFADGSSVFVYFYQWTPRPARSWFVRWDSQSAGVTCAAQSPRNVHCPGCSLRHVWATSMVEPWSVFSISSSSTTQGSIHATVDSTSCPSALCTASFSPVHTQGANVDLSNMKLVMPDVRVTTDAQQNNSDWLLIPRSSFNEDGGSSCGTLDANMFDFVHQSGDFCSSNFSSCLGKQLGHYVSDLSYRVLSVLGNVSNGENEMSSGSSLPRIRLTGPAQSRSLTIVHDGRDMPMQLSLAVDLGAASIGFKQPVATVSSNWRISPPLSSQIQMIHIDVTNTGDLPAYFTMNINCSSQVVASSNASLLLPGITTELAVELSITTPQAGSGVACTGQLQTTTLPYWRQNDKSANLPTLAVPTQPNGCWSSVLPNPTLFKSSSEWATADLETLFEDGGLLGPNPAALTVSGAWLLLSSREYQNIAQFSVTAISTTLTEVWASVTCTNGASASSSTPTRHSLVANVSTALEHSFGLLGEEHEVQWDCRLVLALDASPCASSVGTSISQPFPLLLPPSPCFSSNSTHEPSLFIPIDSWKNRMNATVPQPSLMDLQISGWSAPIPAVDWIQMGIDPALEPIPFSTFAILTSTIRNAGEETGNFSIEVSCSGGPVFSRALSVRSGLLEPNKTSEVRLIVVANETATLSLLPSCTLIVSLDSPLSVCWSPVGKLYLQSFTLPRSNVLSPPTASTQSKQKADWFGIGRTGSIALLVVIVIFVVALGLALAAFYLTKHFGKSYVRPDEESMGGLPTSPSPPSAQFVAPPLINSVVVSGEVPQPPTLVVDYSL